MKYSDFKEALYRIVRKQCGAAGVKVRILEKDGEYTDAETKRLIKMCNARVSGPDIPPVSADLLCIAWRRKEQPRILYWDVEQLYANHAAEGWKSVLPEIAAKVWTSQNSRNALRLLNYQNNAHILANAVYWRFGDMALVLHNILDEDPDGYVMEIFDRNREGRSAFSDEILLTNGLLCSGTLFPAKLYYLGQFRQGTGGYRLTTSGGMRSAVSFFYPGIRERLTDRFRGDFYVGFPNAREAVIQPAKDGGPGKLRTYVNAVVAGQDVREYLTDKVYRFHSKQNRLTEV